MKARPTKFKCSKCNKTLRTYGETTIGPRAIIGEEIEGLTIVKVFRSKADWYTNVRVGNWVTVDGQRICKSCQEY